VGGAGGGFSSCCLPSPNKLNNTLEAGQTSGLSLSQRSVLHPDKEVALYATELKQSYSTYLLRYPWDCYFTVTTRKPRKDSINLAGALWRTLEKFNASRSFTAIESHPMGHGLHAHGLVRFPDWSGYHSASLWKYLFKQFGRSEIGEARSIEQVSSYCAKYVVKNHHLGDYFFFGDGLSWIKDDI